MLLVMERMIKEARIKELLTGQKQFGKVFIIDRRINSVGREFPKIISEHEFFNPNGLDDITISIIYQKWQVAE